MILASSWLNNDLAEISHAVSWMMQHGMKVVVIGPPFSAALPRLLVIGSARAQQSSARTTLDADQAAARQNYGCPFRDQWKVPYISAFDDLCVEQASNATGFSGQEMVSVSDCPAFAAPGVPIYFDAHHFTLEGSVLYAVGCGQRGSFRPFEPLRSIRIV